MKMQIKNTHPLPFHALVLSLYPVLALMARNIEEIVPTAPLRSLLISLGAALALLAAWLLILHDLGKAGLMTSWMLLLFFTYGHLYIALEAAGLGRHRYLIPLYVILLGLGVWLIIWKFKESKKLTLWLNLASLLLLIYPLFTITRYAIAVANSRQTSQPEAIASILTVPESETPPDIYYIILDSYTRADALETTYAFDNSVFLDTLVQMGFYVADCSRSNYAITSSSLASTLNLNYLDVLIPDRDTTDTDRTPVYTLDRHSLVWQELGKLEYTRVAFESGYWQTSLDDAEIYYTAPLQNLNGFEVMLLRTTAGRILLDAQTLSDAAQSDRGSLEYRDHILRERYKLQTLSTVVQLPSPKFIFAHLIVPHDPFIFRPDGSVETDVRFYATSGKPIDEEHYKLGYVQQVQFINSRILPILQEILSASATPPIIIVQGDHGVGVDRMVILNAYYLPEGYGHLYPSITPVNSFRIIFNEYFGTNYPLLPDVSYWSTYDDSFDFTIVPEENPACLAP